MRSRASSTGSSTPRTSSTACTLPLLPVGEDEEEPLPNPTASSMSAALSPHPAAGSTSSPAAAALAAADRLDPLASAAESTVCGPRGGVCVCEHGTGAPSAVSTEREWGQCVWAGLPQAHGRGMQQPRAARDAWDGSSGAHVFQRGQRPAAGVRGAPLTSGARP